MQSIIVVLLFLGATGYLVWTVRKQFSKKATSCEKGCGCSAVDITKIEQEIMQKKKA